VGPRAGLKALAKRKFPVPTGNGIRSSRAKTVTTLSCSGSTLCEKLDPFLVVGAEISLKFSTLKRNIVHCLESKVEGLRNGKASDSHFGGAQPGTDCPLRDLFVGVIQSNGRSVIISKFISIT
jgi:hypothetical protein